jgi:trimethylamine--corrinoid protein Co-methyltransferase
MPVYPGAFGPTPTPQRAIEILETHQPEPLPDGAAERIRSIVEEAEKEVGVK